MFCSAALFDAGTRLERENVCACVCKKDGHNNSGDLSAQLAPLNTCSLAENANFRKEFSSHLQNYLEKNFHRQCKICQGFLRKRVSHYSELQRAQTREIR